MRRFWSVLRVFLVAIGAGALAWLAWSQWSALKGDNAASRYVTATADTGTIRQVAQANGTINPVSVINVGTQISGVVKVIRVDYNDRVTEGDILAELDPRLLEASLAQSRAQLLKAQAGARLARINLERREKTVTSGGSSKADVDAAQQQVDATQADVEIATAAVKRDETNLAFAVIKAPVSGVILSRDVTVGQTVAASFQTPTLFRIAPDLRRMQINTSLSEADVGGIKAGMQTVFTVDAFEGRDFRGRVRQVRLNPTTVQNVVTYDAVIDVENEDLSLLPGMTAFVRIRLGEARDVLRVPNLALRFRPKDTGGRRGGARGAQGRDGAEARGQGDRGERGKPPGAAVFVLSDGKPKRVPVTTGLTDGRFTQITGGKLKDGDELITGEAQEQGAGGWQGRSGGFGGPRF